MAPVRSRKRKSTASAASTTADISDFHAPPVRKLATKLGSPARTPMRSPTKRQTIMITQAQKQALMDNLQLEITERARKLRGQYGLQCQTLRSRIEIRVNRIPTALRKANMQQLLVKNSALVNVAKPATTKPATTVTDTLPRGRKRTSDESFGDENEDVLPNPKKRTKAVMKSTINLIASDEPAKEKPAQSAADPKQKVAKGTASRAKMQAQVLSPKSSNSRTLPRSPIRPLPSPGKSFLARPVSPLKSATGALAGLVEKAKTRATSRKTAGERTASNSSTGTVVSKAKAPPKKATAPRKPAVSKAVAKKPAAAKAVEPVPATGRRTLRKRN